MLCITRPCATLPNTSAMCSIVQGLQTRVLVTLKRPPVVQTVFLFTAFLGIYGVLRANRHENRVLSLHMHVNPHVGSNRLRQDTLPPHVRRPGGRLLLRGCFDARALISSDCSRSPGNSAPANSDSSLYRTAELRYNYSKRASFHIRPSLRVVIDPSLSPSPPPPCADSGHPMADNVAD